MGETPLDKFRVHKGNYLVEAKYRLSLIEQRILAVVFSKINPKIQKMQNPYRFTVSEYCQLAGCDEKGMHKKLRKAVRELRERTLIKYDPEMGVEHGFGWITRYEAWDDGVYELYIEPKLSNDLLAQREYTSYFLETGFKVDSKYSLRLYEIAKQWQAAGSFKKSVQMMREMMGLTEGEYSAYGMFKSRCLNRAINEINTKTELQISFEERKKGKKVEVLEFTIKVSPVSLQRKKKIVASEEGDDLKTIGDVIDQDIDENVVNDLGLYGITKIKANELISSFGSKNVRMVIDEVKNGSFAESTNLAGVVINKLEKVKTKNDSEKKRLEDKESSDQRFLRNRNWWNINHKELFEGIESTSDVPNSAYIQLSSLTLKFIEPNFESQVREYIEKRKSKFADL